MKKNEARAFALSFSFRQGRKQGKGRAPYIKWTGSTKSSKNYSFATSHLPFVRYVVKMFFWDYFGNLEGLWEYAWGQSVGDNLWNSVHAIGKCVQDFMADDKIHKPTLAAWAAFCFAGKKMQ